MAATETQLKDLGEKARRMRIDILKMLHGCGSGHTGGSLSSTDIVTALYFYKMKYDPKNPGWDGRDHFVLSKGHAAPMLYAALAHAGYFEQAELCTLRKLGSRLQGHPDSKNLPGVEISTGSLGQGLSVANGIALARRLDKGQNRVYALLGDGELQEGQIWEAAMTAAHYKLDNLCALVDNNGLQIDGPVAKVMNVEPITDKWRAFGWEVMDIDGHSIAALCDALDRAETVKGKPVCIVCRTVKGKGCSLFEGKVEFHGTTPSNEELETALKELAEGACI
ncbi:MAG: transketolase [Nitrospirae bacterium GWC2_57_13]|jgi:transketolase|nr:MAG: transketolase [Nitrospirae bacterium GWC2_57_13]OGW43631.1 MAG: transketolase [Nitrospirae bacterium GWD2_57_8]